jgi:hypothetical protein
MLGDDMRVSQATEVNQPGGLIRIEKLMIGIIGVMLAVDFILIARRSLAVEWNPYLFSAVSGTGLICVGMYYRRVRAEPRIGLSFISGGAFVLFTMSAQMLNYLILPHRIPAIDETLVRIDSYLGYSWAGLVEWGAEHPTTSLVLAMIYGTSIPQVLLVIIVLATTQRAETLYRFMLTGILSFLIATLLWYILPSSGPSAVVAISPETAAAAHLIVGPDYGAKLRELGLSGPTYLSSRDALGLIAFPSYHLVISLMAVWFTRGIRWVFPLLFALTIPMLPAVLLHGGHHMVDLIGGAVTFALALGVSDTIVRRISPPRLSPNAAQVR